MGPPTCVAILVLENEERLRSRVTAFFQANGFQVYEAKDGGEALEVLRDMPRPALVFADLLMPSVDVHSLVGALGPDDRFVILPVIVRQADIGIEDGYSRVKEPIGLDDLLRIATGLCWRRN
jgi:CheY-like chemotaxis protein